MHHIYYTNLIVDLLHFNEMVGVVCGKGNSSPTEICGYPIPIGVHMFVCRKALQTLQLGHL